MVRAFMGKHGLEDGEFFGRCNDPRIVALRRDLIRQMDATGLFTRSEISSAMCMNRGTVTYWLDDEERESRTRRNKANRQYIGLYHWWEQCAQAMEPRT